ncbi:MAG: ArsR/SmtB family transcription factor [Pseudomonadales bacterium]
MNSHTAATALESLGNETRLRIFRTLVRAGPAGLPVGSLKDKLDIPGSTLSHHIAHLVGAGLMAQNREGRTLRCTANFGTMRDLVDYLVAECCADDDGRC